MFPDPAKGSAVALPRPQPRPQLPRCRILVVDDNEDAAATLAVLLGLIGHQTHVAHDGLEALDAAAACRPDVVLLDIDLPKLSGHEVARQLRAQPWGRDITLVAVTAMDQELHRQESRRSGFDAHVVKPADSHTLVALLAALLARRSNRAGP
jgi:CheY-like chemotaxis protein